MARKIIIAVALIALLILGWFLIDMEVTIIDPM